MAKLYVTVGISGSGKSTWAREFSQAMGGIKIIEPDAIRAELCGDEADQSKNHEVWELAYKRAFDELETGHNAIFCATMLYRKSREELVKHMPKNTQIIYVYFVASADLELCLARNNARSRHVPEEVVRRQYSTFEPFITETEEYELVFADGHYYLWNWIERGH